VLTTSPNLRLGALAVGAIFLLIAALAPRLWGAARGNRAATWARVATSIVAAAILGWGLIPYLDSRSPSQPHPAAPSSSAPAPVDLVDAASVALEDCPRATAPTVPDGATASREQMTSARTDFQAYDKATNAYVHCVDTTIERIASQYAGVASPTELKSLKAFGLGAHDTAIDQEQAVADQFNGQVRAYRAKHPKS
jgi:hypothetical protein